MSQESYQPPQEDRYGHHGTKYPRDGKYPGTGYDPEGSTPVGVVGSFLITRCVTNGTLLLEGIAGKGSAGQTVEVFDGSGGKIAELGKVDADGRFSGNVGPPNPFRVGDTVIVRIGDHVGSCTAS